MKRMKLFLTAVSLFFLAGCFDINEDIDVKPDGSGVYAVHTDMSQLLQAMQKLSGKRRNGQANAVKKYRYNRHDEIPSRYSY